MFPTHELRLFLAALVKWAANYPPKRAAKLEFLFREPRPMIRPSNIKDDDNATIA